LTVLPDLIKIATAIAPKLDGNEPTNLQSR
jgi:hypothetical protein